MEHSTKLLKSELVDRYNELLDVCAHWLAGSGVEARQVSVMGGDKLSWGITDVKGKLRFTQEDVDNLKICLENHVEARLEQYE